MKLGGFCHCISVGPEGLQREMPLYSCTMEDEAVSVVSMGYIMLSTFLSMCFPSQAGIQAWGDIEDVWEMLLQAVVYALLHRMKEFASTECVVMLPVKQRNIKPKGFMVDVTHRRKEKWKNFKISHPEKLSIFCSLKQWRKTKLGVPRRKDSGKEWICTYIHPDLE